MSLNLEACSLGDPLHFSAPSRWSPPWDQPLACTELLTDPTWSTRTFDVWRAYEPADAPVVDQGWKIHVSTTVDTAQRVVALVGRHCQEHRIPWKHALSLAMVVSANGRSCHRASSGKSIAVYPPDLDAFVATADSLAELLRGEPGPYVLSDRQWVPDAPVYFRYGAFRALQAWTEDGRRVPALRVRGELVEDDRHVPYRNPRGIDVPDQIRARTTPHALPDDLPVTLVEAVQHSGCGGVYRGRLRADESPVVVKEARPWTGGTPMMAASIERLAHEARVLDELGGVATPRLRATFTLDGHLFVAADQVPGVNLRHWVAAHHPQLTAHPTPHALDQYARDCARISDGLTRAVAGMHAAGWAHNDLHPGNVIVGPELDVRLADLEFASHPDSTERPGMDCAGFARADGTARDRDLFGLLMIQAWMWHPGVGPLVELVPETLDQHTEIAARWFGAAAAPVRAAAAAYARSGRRARVAERTRHTIHPAGPAVTVADLVAYLSEVATPDEQVLFPGGTPVHSSTLDSLSLAHGTGGILLALVGAGEQVRPEWVEHFARTTDAPPSPLSSPGLWDGWTGVALAWALLGDERRADLALGRARAALDGCTDPTVWSGLAGHAWGLLGIAKVTGDSSLRHAARRVLGALAHDADGWAGRAGPPGLLHGPSGIGDVLAVAAVELDELGWSAAAARLVERDVSRCVRGATGTLDLTDAGTSLPYLGHGSVGVALARRQVGRTLGRSPDDVDSSLLRAGMVDLMVEPGLIHGRLGIAYALRLLGTRDESPDAAAARRWATVHTDSLPLYAVGVGRGIGIVGRGGGRLSADLATGAAGAVAVLSHAERPALIDLLLGQSLDLSHPQMSGQRTADHGLTR
ncbi:MAG: class III lanthionine synthetase LanKC [Cellulomonas sp.]|uniref:Serine/threonine protein kinase n=1 Tax=Cellulomonas gelida TaxID=1712 RepID=A0A4Y3KNU2_9CELL|nr:MULTISPECIES: class III lanthionine synthetase LanKC [Cellulomonas]MCR6649001.1 class III lanthionine synthetase LanKC [Cellulomonas sp.]MCR6704989.1 class III lanthionine synthetase LanKC [Cellulomonas sp.]GEA85712.1 serine/threonine protein kinase [Cellulomonas gelida]GGL39104.1 serine/threonine protein kinase [Cellulomonas gelida]